MKPVLKKRQQQAPAGLSQIAPTLDYVPKARTFPTRVKKYAKPEAPTEKMRAAKARGAYDHPRTKIVVDGEELEVNQNIATPHRPTPQTRYQVQMMSAYGIQQEVMAKLLRTSPEVLQKYYREELDTGQDRATSLVASRLFKTAAFGKGKEHVTAAIFWLKTRGKGRFNETQRHELTGKDGAPITHAGVELTDEERAVRLFQLFASRAEEDAGQNAS